MYHPWLTIVYSLREERTQIMEKNIEKVSWNGMGKKKR